MALTGAPAGRLLQSSPTNPTRARMDRERRVVYTAPMAYTDRITISRPRGTASPVFAGCR